MTKVASHRGVQFAPLPMQLAKLERAGAALNLLNEAARSADGWEAMKR